MEQLEHLECTGEAVGQALKPLANKPPDKGIMASQSLKRLEDHIKSSGHLSYLEEATQTRPEPGDQVQATSDLTTDRTGLYNAEKDQLAATLGQLSLNLGPAINDHPGSLRRTKSTYHHEEASPDAVFLVKTFSDRFSLKPGHLRPVNLSCLTTWVTP